MAADGTQVTPAQRVTLPAQNACLHSLSERAMSFLKPHLSSEAYHAGTVLWEPDRPAHDVYFPVSGMISIVLVMRTGECVEVGSVAREAATAHVGSDQSAISTKGIVQIGGSFVRVAAAQLILAASKNREIGDLVSFCRDWILLQAQQIAVCNTVHTADQRFCRWLVQCSQRMEKDTLSLTQESIAALLGLRRTTVTLIARALQTKGSIHYRRGKILISDPRALQTAACECARCLDKRHWPSTRLANFKSPTVQTPSNV